MVEGKVTEVTRPRARATALGGFYSERGVTACAKILVLILFLKGRGFKRLRRSPGFGWRSAFSAAIRPYFNEGFSLWGTRTIVFPQAARGRDQRRQVDPLFRSAAPHLFIFGVFAHVLRVGLVFRAGMHRLEVSIELTLQRLLVFLASRTMAGGLNVESNSNTGCAFRCYWNIPEPFCNPQRRFFHASQFPIAPIPWLSVGFHSVSQTQQPLV